MLKNTTSILLIITTSVSLMGGAIPSYVWYLVNYDYIVTYMCVNRDKPQMHCNGKCQLKKMVHSEHHNHNKQKPMSPTTQKHKIDLFVVENNHMRLTPFLALMSSAHDTNQMETLCFYKPATPPPQMS